MGNIHLSLRLCTFVSLSSKRLEVLALAHILQLFDVGIVDLEAELIKFSLDTADYVCLEQSAMSAVRD